MTSAPPSTASTPLPFATQVGATAASVGTSTEAYAALPPSSTFDILPLLHETLSRLLAFELANSANATTITLAPTARMYPNEQPLAIPSLAVEASKIRNRIRRARNAVEALPDMDRDLEEQEEELKELRERIKAQRAVLHGLAKQD